MLIHVTRNGQQLGPYSLEEIKSRLCSGAVNTSDLGWHEGLADWVPLSSIPGIVDLSAPQPSNGSDAHAKSSEFSETPELWNPVAVANWSVLFSPAFGALLVANNWRRLKQPKKAKTSMLWFYVSVVFLFANLAAAMFLASYDSELPFFILLCAWYFASGKKQWKHIKTQSITYTRKAWGKPIVIAVCCYVVYAGLAVGGVFTVESLKTRKSMESQAVALVTEIVQKQFGSSAACKAVSVDKEIADNFYNGLAYMSDGNELKITIEQTNGQIRVVMPPQ